MTRVRPVPTALLLLLALLVVSLVSARPAAADEVMQRAAEALRSSPVYVDPGAENLIDDAAADQLLARVESVKTPTFVVVRRPISSNDYRNANEFLSDLRRRTGREACT
jgi:hypothetical protein